MASDLGLQCVSKALQNFVGAERVIGRYRDLRAAADGPHPVGELIYGRGLLRNGKGEQTHGQGALGTALVI